MPKRVTLLIAVAVCAVLYGAARLAARVTPTQVLVATAIEGKFTEGGGWYPGEPFVTARPLRAWGSWCGSDENTGTLRIGPFPAPGRLRFALGGYPNRPGIEIHLERVATKERIRIEHPDVGERWRIADRAIPAGWLGEPVVLVASDQSKLLGGWMALTEPLRGDVGDGHAALWGTLSAWAINGALLGLLWWAAVCLQVRLAWLPATWIPLVAAAVVAACGYVTFWAYFAHPTFGKSVSLLWLVVAAIVVWRAPTRLERERAAEAATVGRLTALIGFFYLSLLHIFPVPLDFSSLAANRFRDTLPNDNTISSNLSARLYEGNSPRQAGGDWLSSDRPPLQSGWQLLTLPVLTATKLDARTSLGTAGVWFQLLWVSAVYGLLRTLGLGVRRTLGWVAALSCTGFFLQHTVFIWPKLSAGALACGAFALWVLRRDFNGDRPLTIGASSPPDRRLVLIGAALAGLACLSHGGVAFSFLILVPWVAWRCLRKGEAGLWLQAALVVGFLAAPWLAYQKFYDPPGNRLLKWHLGGQTTVDGRGTWETIRSSYGALTWREILARKRDNFAYPTIGDFSGLVDIAPERAKSRRHEEFFYIGRALTWWLGGLLLAPLVVARLTARRDLPRVGGMHLALFAWPALTLLVWCALLFNAGSAIVHQGSFAMMIAAFVLVSAWFELVNPRWLAAVAGLQALSFASTWIGPNDYVNGSPNSWAVGLATVAGLALMGVVGLAFRRGEVLPTENESIRTTTPSPVADAWSPAAAPTARFGRFAPWLAAALALVPFIWCVRGFSDLWWFGDDWDLLDRINRSGFWRWTLEPFAENFVPLFKALWGGLVYAGGGSYLPMVAVLWATHAVNTALFTKILLRAGFSGLATAMAVVVFALTFANIETLGWSVQWSALLAVMFFLLAALGVLKRFETEDAAGAGALLLLALWSAASALAFARGVLTGTVLAAVCLLPLGALKSSRKRIRTALACLLPALGVAGTIVAFSPGNHHALAGHLLEVADFGFCYWAATPLYRLLELGSWDRNSVTLIGAVKIAIIVLVFRHAPSRQRPVLALFLLLDLGNAVLLGIGRYHTDIPNSNSERYQYNALLCTMPFFALAFERWLSVLPPPRLRRNLAAALVVLAALRVMHGWPAAVESFASSRGRNTRELLLRAPNPPAEGAVPGIPFLPTARAKELIVLYHLH